MHELPGDVDRTDKGFRLVAEDMERRIFRGTMCHADGARVGVLVVEPHCPALRKAYLERLLHEHRLKSRLAADWAVEPLAFAQDECALYLRDPGFEPLAGLVGKGLPVERALRIAMALAAAVGKMHASGLLHRDIKTANVFVNAAGDAVRLTGFGIASPFTRTHVRPSQRPAVAGTFAYMAPEQTGRMNRVIDERSDLYSVGVILYEVLTGSLPLVASSPAEWIHSHLARQPQPPAERNPAIPRQLSDIVMKLLSKAAEDRYQTATGLVSDLGRCHADARIGRDIRPFPLGCQDRPDRIKFRDGLYGRAVELGQLEAAFARVAGSGRAEIVLVAGYSGIGKSSLIHELRKVLAPTNAIFAIGKFDQYHRDEPYATLAQAFQPLVRDLLGRPDEEIGSWRAALRCALGDDARLLVDLVPDLKHLVDAAPAVSELSGQEARRRFLAVFRAFVAVFARSGHPLVLFLDDLQWLDAATLDMFRSLAADDGIGHLLLIGSYRSNELAIRPALRDCLDGLRALPRRPLEIGLGGIGSAQMTRMIADALHSVPAAVAALTDCIMRKTGDNPFFAVQFVGALEDEGLLAYDRHGGGWYWDLERIRLQKIGDNIVDLMIERLRRLPDASLRAVRIMACMGTRVARHRLGIALDRPAQAVSACLKEAVDNGLLLEFADDYAFAHDGIHEAAYAMSTDEGKQHLHFRIGMLLVEHTPDGELDNQVFEIVSHLNRAGEFGAREHAQGFVPGHTPASACALVAALNLRAGRKARRATAYGAACEYLETGLARLSGSDFAARDGLAFELALEHAECRFLGGGIDEAKVLVESVLASARTELEVAAACRLKVELHVVCSENALAVDAAVTALRSLGIVIALHPDDGTVHRTLQAAWRRLDGGPALPALPAMTDPLRLMAMRLLSEAWPPACFTDFNFAIMVACSMVELSLSHGRARSSNQGFALLGLLLGPALGRYKEGYRLALQASELASSNEGGREASRTFNTMAMTATWTQPLSASLHWSRLAWRKGMEAGDVYFACYSAFHSCIHLFMQGQDLGAAAADCRQYLRFAQDTGFRDGAALVTIIERAIAALRGETRHLTDFSDGTFDGAAFEAGMDPGRHIVHQFYWTMKGMLHYLAGDPSATLAMSDRFDAGPRNQIHLIRHLEHHFYSALAAATAMDTASGSQRQALRRRLDSHHAVIRKWATQTQSPTFADKDLLVSAEVARLDGQTLEAEQFYERSVRAAQRHGFRHTAGLANELAARFYQARGFERIAEIHLRDALEAYGEWGASSKVRQLLKAHPNLHRFGAEGGLAGAAYRVDRLDYVDILKESLSASGELAVDRLLSTLMHAVMEHTGAQSGALLRLHPSRALEFLASAEATARGVSVRLREEGMAKSLPESVLRHMWHVNDKTIVDDAAIDPRFALDPCVIQRGIRSVLCVPVTSDGKQHAILYLENNHAARAFTASQADILALLTTHAAMSLENARLYAELEKRESRLRQLMDSDAIGIQFWDMAGLVTYANDAFLRMIRYDRADLDNGAIRWRDMTPPEWADDMKARLEELKATGAMRPWEKEYLRKDGSRVPILIGAATFGTTNAGVAFVLDLSDRKAAEGRALDSERRNRELHIELAHANRVATMGHLSAWIAHDVKQPLAGIVNSGNAALLSLSGDTPDLPSTRRALEGIVRDGMRAAEILDRTRALVRKASPRSEGVDINEVVTETIALISPEARRKGIRIFTLLSDAPMRPIADKVQLQQIMLNLLVNAIEAMDDQAGARCELHVATDAAEAGGCLVEVRDTGPGIPAGRELSCFDAFFTTKSGALGMGLPVCRSIVEQFGGRIWAVPNDPRGTIIRFVLPRPGAAGGVGDGVGDGGMAEEAGSAT